MKSRAMTVAVLGLVAIGVAASSGRAADAEVTLDVASAYVFRGATLNEDWVAQPGLSVSGLPIDLGVWANLDIGDNGGTLAEGDFSEIDLAASYAIPVEGVDLSVGYTEYVYPGGGSADREFNLVLGVPLVLSPSVAVYYGVDGAIDDSFYVEAGVEHEFALSEDLALAVSAALGYMAPDTGDSGFSHFSAGAGLSYGPVGASVTYIGQIDDSVLPDEADGGLYDVDIVGMVSVAHSF